MDYRYEFEVSGPLFDNPGNRLKKAVTQALATTTNEGKRAVKSTTRVDTGRLKRNWVSEEVSWSEFYLGNDVPYATIWEYREQMLSAYLPYIEDQLEKNLDAEIPRWLDTANRFFSV